MQNPYEIGTFKHDFIELLAKRNNIIHLNARLEMNALMLAEIAEIIMIAGIHGNVYGEENGKDTKEQSQM